MDAKTKTKILDIMIDDCIKQYGAIETIKRLVKRGATRKDLRALCFEEAEINVVLGTEEK